MQKIRTLRTMLLVQFWFNVVFGGLIGLGTVMAVLLPNLLAARERAEQAAAMAGNPVSLGGIGPAEVLAFIFMAASILLTVLVFMLPMLILRGMDRGQDMTKLLWVNAVLSLLNFPVGTVMGVIEIMNMTDGEASLAIREGRAGKEYLNEALVA